MIGLITNFYWRSTNIMKDLWVMIRSIADSYWRSVYERDWP